MPHVSFLWPSWMAPAVEWMHMQSRRATLLRCAPPGRRLSQAATPDRLPRCARCGGGACQSVVW